MPRPRNGSALGRQTIETCGLDRPALLTHYTDHVNRWVRPAVAALMAVVKRGEVREVVETWRRTMRVQIHNPSAPFRALSYDALEVLVPPSTRKKFNLEVEPPRELDRYPTSARGPSAQS